MPEGELLRYLNDVEVSGMPYYYVIPSTATLGGHGNPRFEEFTFFIDRYVEPSLLSIVVSSRTFSGNILWKVSLNNITLTREFKPQTMVELEEGVYAIQVFDVSNITRSFTGKYLLKVSCESSSPVRISAAFLVGSMKYEGMKGYLTADLGILAIKPGEVTSLNLASSHEGKKDLVLMVYDSPSRLASVKVDIDGIASNINEKVGVDELLINKGCGECLVKVLHNESPITYFPKNFKVYGIARYRAEYLGPKIELIRSEVNGSILKCVIKNVGDVVADRVMIVGMGMGEVLFREHLSKIKPGSEVKVIRELSSDRVKPLVIRLIYQDLVGQAVETYMIK